MQALILSTSPSLPACLFPKYAVHASLSFYQQDCPRAMTSITLHPRLPLHSPHLSLHTLFPLCTPSLSDLFSPKHVCCPTCESNKYRLFHSQRLLSPVLSQTVVCSQSSSKAFTHRAAKIKATLPSYFSGLHEARFIFIQHDHGSFILICMHF